MENTLFNILHGQFNPTLTINIQNLDLDSLTLFNNISHLCNPVSGKLRDVNQSIFVGKNVDEGTKVGNPES